jgi:hypothetical protein
MIKTIQQDTSDLEAGTEGKIFSWAEAFQPMNSNEKQTMTNLMIFGL